MNLISFLSNLRLFPSTVINKINFIRKHVIVQTGTRIKGKIFITGHGTIVIGNHIRINSCLESNPIGGDTRTVFNTFNHGTITIGDNSGISNCAICSRERVEIGKNVMIGGGTQIFDNDFHSLALNNRLFQKEQDIPTKPVIIKDGVFIGARCIILKGVTIGYNSVIGAGSVLTKNVPDNEIWAGNPASLIRRLHD